MFENGNDVLMSEDFDELYVSPDESRRVQFQPTRLFPEPTGTTTNEPVQQPELVTVSDNGNRRSQPSHKTAVKY